MILTDIPEVLSLSPEEKLQLIDELILSIYSSEVALEPTREEKAALDSRWENYLQNPSSALTVEEFRKKMTDLRT